MSTTQAAGDVMHYSEVPQDTPNGFFLDKHTLLFGFILNGQAAGILMSPKEAHGMALALLEAVALHELTAGLTSAVPAGQV